MLKKYKSFFNDRVILFKNKKFIDKRGFFTETYNYKEYSLLNCKDNFVQDNLSLTKKKNTIRGLHFQKGKNAQSKIIKVIKGKIFDVVVDIDKKSKTYGKSKSFILDEKNDYSLYIHKSFAHGFYTLSDKTIVYYKVSKYYSPVSEKTIIWNDKNLNIKWPKQKNTILSNKDSKGISFKEL